MSSFEPRPPSQAQFRLPAVPPRAHVTPSYTQRTAASGSPRRNTRPSRHPFTGQRTTKTVSFRCVVGWRPRNESRPGLGSAHVGRPGQPHLLPPRLLGARSPQADRGRSDDPVRGGFHTTDPHTVTAMGTNARRVSLLVVPPHTPVASPGRSCDPPRTRIAPPRSRTSSPAMAFRLRIAPAHPPIRRNRS